MAHAVVIGASIAGLCAAKALAGRFDKVTVLERDRLPDAVSTRKGVPQGNHAHVLLAAGQQALSELFPGIDSDLVNAGAIPFDPGSDMAVYRFGGVWPRVEVGLRLVSFSRPLLDAVIARRMAEVSNVEIRSGIAVTGLTGDAQRVTGVTTGTGESAQELPAQLVVDASGRGSRSDPWLEALGAKVPGSAEVKVGVGYATRILKREPGYLPEGVGVYVLPTPPDKRFGVILPIEDDRWLVTVGGWHGDFPRDEDDVLGFAASLPHPRIHEVLSTGVPMGDLHVYTFPSSKRRHFEKVHDVPEGYVATGDTVCSFNPIYGQGITVAAFNALALRDTVDPHEFYRRVAANLKVPWSFAVGGDFAFPETTGPRPSGGKLLRGYARRLQMASREDPEVRRAFTSVQHLIEPPTILFRPSVALRVIRAGRHSASA